MLTLQWPGSRIPRGSPMTVQLTAQTAVAPRLWTVEVFYRMAETGILKPDERVELIEGVVLTMPPIGPGHGGHVNRGIRIFSRPLGDRVLLSVQNALHL